uniref:RNA polymerase sigma factor n=1 Tax=Pedobacter schmidteae TaxID=2201271 RepID=UPI000EAEBEB4|nr:RNA polymerase sigma-70 factor [Pedobacter schmidteae]
MAVTKQIEETELLEQLRDGKVWAFDELYHSYSGPLLWKLRRMVKDAEEADELLQDLFVKVWERREQITVRQSFESYLYRMAERMAIDYFRKLARQSKLYEQVQAGSTEVVEDLEELLFAKETQSLLNDAIAALPEQRRRAFTLCKLEGKSHQEAAELMNISPNTVHNHLVKAVSFVKDHLEKSGKSLSPLALIICIATMNS